MTPTDVVIWLFSACNAVRLFAYIPQIASIAADRNGASGVSVSSWTLFTLGNATTVAYASVVVDDTRMMLLFGLNTAFSLAIVAATLAKRWRGGRGCRRPRGASS